MAKRRINYGRGGSPGMSDREAYLRLLVSNQMAKNEAQRKQSEDTGRLMLQSLLKEHPEVATQVFSGRGIDFGRPPTPFSFTGPAGNAVNAVVPGAGLLGGEENQPLAIPPNATATYDKRGRLKGYTTHPFRQEARPVPEGLEKSFYKEALVGNVTVPEGGRISRPELLRRGAEKAGFEPSIGPKGTTFRPSKKTVDLNQLSDKDLNILAIGGNKEAMVIHAQRQKNAQNPLQNPLRIRAKGILDKSGYDSSDTAIDIFIKNNPKFK